MIRLPEQSIPGNADQWKAEVSGIVRFLSEMQKTRMGEYDYWRKGMVKHYTARLKFLRQHKPRGVK